ncbi:hypothetical protein PBT90_08420 [Algoriphagus halophytocola]|uniref:beta-galactosidase n=1 Tax=Algoriphagus halophytocola TaxID=2991499 RepID=A0ABY6MMH9_9BACT|nr:MULTISPECIES: sugar-binding domain-containing protein [unclassified Algoriphagus]UZD23409.1 hypothetical protein OM944_02735 [Algoriphagus sp. TR-M5]WBL44704.1 hypothetical protein PBT90_08420 [Algoriphagus sp. TR-M9]
MQTHRTWLLGLFIFFQLTLLSAQSPTKNISAHRFYLSGQGAETKVYWDFKVSSGRKSGDWSKILVPSNWEMQGFGKFHPPSREVENPLNAEQETGIYRHRFFANSAWKRKEINLVFEGVLAEFEVTLNGENLVPTYSENLGKTVYPISENIDLRSENVLEVKVYKYFDKQYIKKYFNTKGQWIFGGIYRPVYLEILPKFHFSISSLEARAEGTLKAQLDFFDTSNSAEVLLELYDLKSGESIGRSSQQVTGKSVFIDQNFSGIVSWSPEHPKLYEARFSVVQGGKIRYQQSETIGFKTFNWTESNEVIFNGKPLKIKAVERVSFYPTTARTLSKQHILEDIQLLKAMNANAVVMPLIGAEEYFLDLADSLGMLIIPGIKSNNFNPSLLDLEGRSLNSIRMENAGKLTFEAVVRDDLGGVLDCDEQSSPAALLGPYRSKSALYYSYQSNWSPIQILDFDLKDDASTKVLVRNNFHFSDLSTSQILWAVDKIEAWDQSRTLYSGSLTLPKTESGDSVWVDVKLPANWRDGDLLRVTPASENAEAFNPWSVPLRRPQAGNAAYFKSRAVWDEQAVLVRESSTDLQFSVGERLFVFGKTDGLLQMVKINRDLIYLSQYVGESQGLSIQREVTWKQQDDGSVKILSLNTETSAYYSWTVFPSGEVLLKAGYGLGDSGFSKLGFRYKVSGLKEVKWIGNGPLPVSEPSQQRVNFGLWQQSTSPQHLNLPSLPWESKAYGNFPDIHAFQLISDRSTIELRTETEGLAVSLQNMAREKMDLAESSRAFENLDLWIEPTSSFENQENGVSKEVARKVEETVIWFRFF